MKETEIKHPKSGTNVWMRQSEDEPTIFGTLNDTVANRMNKRKQKNFGRDFVMSHNVVRGGEKSPKKRVAFED